MEHSEARRDLTLEFWMEISKLLPPSPVILDLGSHGMEEAQILLPMLAGHARWHGFEANPECCHNIRRTVLPRLDRRATVVLNETAVSHSVGTATLYRSKKVDGQPWTPSSSIRKPQRATEYHPWMTFDEGISVPTTTLDYYCQSNDIGPVDLLKMDIQGAEIDAIRGGGRTLLQTFYVLTEVCDGEEYAGQASLKELLAEMPGNWILVERFINDALLKNSNTPSLK